MEKKPNRAERRRALKDLTTTPTSLPVQDYLGELLAGAEGEFERFEPITPELRVELLSRTKFTENDLDAFAKMGARYVRSRNTFRTPPEVMR